MKNRAGLRNRIQYRIDGFFARGGTSIFLFLISMFVAAFLLMGGIRLVLNAVYPDPLETEFREWGSIIWRAALQIFDIGSMGEDTDAAFHNRLIGVLTSLVGLALTSTLLAFVTSIFKEKLESLRRGKSAVLESDHTIILGFGIRTIEIIRELIEANASEKDAAVVILSHVEKEKMDDTISDYLTDTETTRLVTRTGSTSNPLALKKIGVDRARSVVILNPAGPANPPEIKSKADYRVLKSIMAVVAALDGQEMIPVVSKLHYPQNRMLAESSLNGNVVTIDEEQVLSKILVQTSRAPGLTMVYSDLVGFIGNEIYFCPIPEQHLGLTFKAFAFYFKQSVPLGLKSADGEIELNPDPQRTIQEGEEAIILAEDDSTIHFYDDPVADPRTFTPSVKRRVLDNERYLIYGWSPKSPVIIHEYGCYITKDSIIDVAVNDLTEAITSQFDDIARQHPDIQMRICSVDAISTEFPAQLNPEKYDNVIILAGQDNDIEEIDAETISTLLKFRHYFKALEGETGKPVQTQLITEVMDSENVEIMQHAGVRDFIISNQMVSKIMAQMSQDTEVSKVYDILFKAEGSEIYLKRLDLFYETIPETVSFADLMLAAQMRSEVCFGVKLCRGTASIPGENGFYFIPDKDAQFQLTMDDELITLAVDET